MEEWINQSINRSINRPTIDRSIDQSIDQQQQQQKQKQKQKEWTYWYINKHTNTYSAVLFTPMEKLRLINYIW